METKALGSIVWTDLTVENATEVRDFYEETVAGWTASPVSMGEYDDFNMLGTDGEPVAGICHARGPNANLPSKWMVYVRVADVDASAQKAVERGGEVVDGPRKMGPSRFCVVRDPAGAVLALVSGS